MMWELIESNRRKSWLLFWGMGAFLLATGFIGGAGLGANAGADPVAPGLFGMVLAAGVWLVLTLVSYFSGDGLLLASAGAHEITHEIHPQLFNVVEEMKIAASLPAMPKVYLIDEAAPNAFAVGRGPEKCAIAVTAGLLARLGRDELQGVVAHEVSHILNRDVQLMTFAGVMLGSIVFLSDMMLRGSMRGSARVRGRSSGGSNAALVVLALVFALLAPLAARLLYLAISRRREYLADASAARLTRYPEGLASALEKIATDPKPLEGANRVTAALYIVNPLEKGAKFFDSLSSTHPPVGERIRILRALMGTGGAGLAEYRRAFEKVSGDARSLGLLPAQEERVPVRGASAPEAAAESPRGAQHRAALDLMRAANRYAFVSCPCGVNIKIPPDYPEARVQCPRCGAEHDVPGKGAPAASAGDQTYRRRNAGKWETFACACGRTLQLSPMFAGTSVQCGACGEKIEIS